MMKTNNRWVLTAFSITAVLVLAILPVFSSQDATAQRGNTSLLLSDGSRFVAKECYPQFTWAVTPQYFMFADSQRVLRREEVASIADRTGFICIEKSHAVAALGAAELGAKHEVAAFKKLKPGIKVLFYFNSAYAWPFTSYNKGFAPDKIEEHPELKQFLLVDPATGELANRRNVFFFDVLDPEFRKWWVGTVVKGVRESGADGAFIDQMHGFAWLRKDKSDEVQKAMGAMMARLKAGLGPEKILLGNNAEDEIARYVFPTVDAVMFEHYNHKLISKESLLKDWSEMLRIAQAGKISVFRIGVEVEQAEEGRKDRSAEFEMLSRKRLEFYQACFLIGAQPYSYFQFGWGWGLNTGPLVDYHDMLRPLGAPKGAYHRVSRDGWQFTREFDHASIWVDTERRAGKITWRQPSL
jgi:hypothetical protein